MENHSREIAEQMNAMSVTEMVNYYTEHADLIARAPREIHTIGLYYHCMRLGGVERVISLLIPVWLQERYRVVLFTEEEPSSEDFPYPEETVRITLPKDTQGMEKRLMKLEEAIVSERVDFFVYHEWTDYKMFPEMLLIKKYHIPFILYTHGQFSIIYRFMHDYTLNSHKIFALCDLVLTLSETNKHFYELCHCRAMDVQNPIAPELKEIVPIQSAPDNHQVVWIGRFSAEKRPLDAIRIIKHVCEQVPDAVLKLVGSGPEADVVEAQALCRELGIEKNVVFCGQQSDVSRFYKEAAVVLMTSETEGYPNVIIEAKAYGKILAMYALPYLTMTKSGLGLRTAKIGDVKGLATEIARILQDAGLRKMLEDESVQSFAEFRDYSQADLWNAIIKEMEQADTQESVLSSSLEIETNDCNLKDASVAVQEVVHCDDGPLMISMLLNDANIACKRGMKAMESYPDFRVGHAVLKIPRMIKHLLKK